MPDLIRARLLALVAVLVTATAMSPLISGWRWLAELTLVLIVAAALSLAVAVVTNQGAGSLAGLLGTAWMVTIVYAGDAAIWRVLPTPSSITELGALIRLGGQAINQLPPPLPDDPGPRLVLVAGVSAAWWCVDVLVGAVASPALVGLPLLALMVPAAALGPDGLPWWSFALAGVAYLATLLGTDTVQALQWGRLVGPRGGRRARSAPGGALAIGAAVLVALMVPALIPGLHTRLFPHGGSGDDEGTIAVLNPIFNLRDDLTSRSNAEVLSYRTTVSYPEPLRVVNVDTFDGTTWQPTYGVLDRRNHVQNGLPTPPGLDPRTPRSTAVTSIQIDRLQANWLPTPYPPIRIQVAGNWLYDPETLNVVGDHVQTEPGMRYQVTSDLVHPTQQQLENLPVAMGATQWVALPANTPREISQTAAAVAGSGTEYEKAIRLQTWFRSTGGFSYSLDAPPQNGSSAIVDFLHRRSGYCVHFASAMAVMARTLGIPARVAVGYLPGQQLANGSWVIRQDDAHAWPELYFEGIGWVRFEPTPASRAPILPDWATAGVSLPSVPAPTATPTPTRSVAPTPTTASATVSQPPAWQIALESLFSTAWPLLLLAVLIVCGGLAPVVASAWARRRRWRRANSPPEWAEAAWAELVEELGDLGVPVAATATVRQTARRLGRELDSPEIDSGLADASRDALRDLAQEVELARYARRLPDVADAAMAHAQVHLVLKGVRKARPAGQAWRARVFPDSGVRRVGALPQLASTVLSRWVDRLRERFGR